MPPKTEAAQAPLTTLLLLKPHTHARREYPAGAELDIEALGITREDAAWLIGIKTAMNANGPADEVAAAKAEIAKASATE